MIDLSTLPALIERLGDESDLCHNDGADDIAYLLIDAITALKALEAEVGRLSGVQTALADALAERDAAKDLLEPVYARMRRLREGLSHALKVHERGFSMTIDKQGWDAARSALQVGITPEIPPEMQDFADLMVDEVIATTRAQLDSGVGLSLDDQKHLLDQLVKDRSRRFAALATKGAEG